MAGVTMTCRVCGKPYEVCLNAKQIPGVFRWQEVACSPECGSAYLAKVNAARGIAEAEKLPVAEEVAEEAVVESEEAAVAAESFRGGCGGDFCEFGSEEEPEKEGEGA